MANAKMLGWRSPERTTEKNQKGKCRRPERKKWTFLKGSLWEKAESRGTMVSSHVDLSHESQAERTCTKVPVNMYMGANMYA